MFLSKHFSCECTVPEFLEFLVALQHIELINRKRPPELKCTWKWGRLKEAMIISTPCSGSVNSAWHEERLSHLLSLQTETLLEPTWLRLSPSPPETKCKMKTEQDCSQPNLRVCYCDEANRGVLRSSALWRDLWDEEGLALWYLC